MNKKVHKECIEPFRKKLYKEFKEFLADYCWSEEKYGDGKYDRKIFNWFWEIIDKLNHEK